MCSIQALLLITDLTICICVVIADHNLLQNMVQCCIIPPILNGQKSNTVSGESRGRLIGIFYLQFPFQKCFLRGSIRHFRFGS